MKKLLATALAVCSIAGAMTASSATAASMAWIPGSWHTISEKAASEGMETKVDYASCTGIPRFGRHFPPLHTEVKVGNRVYGFTRENPEPEYRVFDCSLQLDGDYCEMRLRVLKGPHPDELRFKLIRTEYSS
jgi:hypothetical protein